MATWAAVFITITLFRPLMPVDETRYLTVAWEMMMRGDWALPTLNYNPYSHKPPLIFWLIHASWEIFGVSVTIARAIIFAAVFTLLALTARLAKAIHPDQPLAPIIAVLLMCAMPAYLAYGSMIMFDSLLAVFVVTSMLIIWQEAQRDSGKNWVWLGFAIGIGLLVKGPVIFVYTLPSALLAPFWIQDRIMNWRRWYGGVFMAFMVAASVGLLWSMPAAIEGGVVYAKRIYLTQSAGRMVNAFDHQEPVWFYVPALIGFLFPLLAWPSMWKAARAGFQANQGQRFLICWMSSSFLFFTLISSKSVHYVVPFLPAIAILAAGYLSTYRSANPKSVFWPLLGTALPSAIVLIATLAGKPPSSFTLDMTGYVICAAHLVLSVGIYLWARRDSARSLYAMVTGSLLLIVVVHAALGQNFLRRYDLSPVAGEMHKYENRPWGAAPKYDGEYGFLFRTNKQFFPLGRENVDWWLAQKENGIVVGRYKEGTFPDQQYYNILFSQPFRKHEYILIFEKKPGVIVPGTEPRPVEPTKRWSTLNDPYSPESTIRVTIYPKIIDDKQWFRW